MSAIKRPIFFYISIPLFLATGYFTMGQIKFAAKAVTAPGQVIKILAENKRCDEPGNDKGRYNCTRYSALVSFRDSSDVEHRQTIDSGKARSHNSPVSMADHRVGDRIEVLYDPENPEKSVQNTFLGLWGLPLALGIFSALFLLAGVTAPNPDWKPVEMPHKKNRTRISFRQD